MNRSKCRYWAPGHAYFKKLVAWLTLACAACQNEMPPPQPMLAWCVFDEPSGAFREAAESCSEQPAGRYRIKLAPIPADADQQREQLVRRLAVAAYSRHPQLAFEAAEGLASANNQVKAAVKGGMPADT